MTIPGGTRIDRALAAGVAREKAALAAARQQKLEAEKAALLARAKKDFAAIAPLLEGEVPKEARPVLEAFVARYEGAKVRVDDVEQSVVIPGLSKVQSKLGGASSAGTKSIGMKFVAIAAGSFEMGAGSQQHRVRLSKSDSDRPNCCRAASYSRPIEVAKNGGSSEPSVTFTPAAMRRGRGWCA